MLVYHQQGHIHFTDPKHITNAFNNVLLLLPDALPPNAALSIIENLFPTLHAGIPLQYHHPPNTTTTTTTSNTKVALPDAVTYRVYLSILSKLNGKGTKALELIQQMKKQHLTPNAIHYSFAIQAISKTKKFPNKAETAHQLLQELEDYHNNDHDHDDDNNNHGRMMMRSNAILYSEVIKCYAQHPDGAQKAEQLLRQLEDRYIETLDKRYKPDIVAYTTVMTAYAYSKDPDSLQKAERMLQRIESKYYNGVDDEYVRPNKICYTSFLLTLAKKGKSLEAAQKAEEIIRKLETMYEESGGDDDDDDESLRPDSQAYSTVIDVWAKSGSALAGERAKYWLNHMEEKYNNGDIFVKPNVMTYTNVINAFKNTSKNVRDDDDDDRWCEEAETILKRVEEKYSNDGDLESAPDVFLYTTVITLWSRAQSPHKAKRAWDIVKRMEQHGVRPNAVTYTAVLNACEHTTFSGDDDDNDTPQSSKTDTLRIALEVFSIMQKSDDTKPNNITYRTILSAVGRLVDNPSQRNNIMSKLFDLCCEAGLVDEIVLRHMKKYTPELYHEKLPTSFLNSAKMNDLPNSWIKQSIRTKQKQYP